MGVCRIRVAVELISAILRDGSRLCEATTPLSDACVLEVRMIGRPDARVVELLVESPTLEGPTSDGRWPAIAEGRWDEFPEFIPSFRVVPDRIEIPDGALDGAAEELARSPGRLELLPPDPREFGARFDAEAESRLMGEDLFAPPDGGGA